MGEYIITGKHVEGISTVGYIAEKKVGGEEFNIKRHDIISMAKKGLIDNVKVLVGDNGSYHLEFDGDIEEVVEHGDTFELLCRILEKTEEKDICVGYILKNQDSKKYKVDIDKAWELAYRGKLKDTEGKIINNKKTIISVKGGDGLKLIDLPTIYK